MLQCRGAREEGKDESDCEEASKRGEGKESGKEKEVKVTGCQGQQAQGPIRYTQSQSISSQSCIKI